MPQLITFFLHFNYFFSTLRHKLVNKVQRVMNCAAPHACKTPRLLVDLHWLPIERRIEYKIATICYIVIACTAPYLSDL